VPIISTEAAGISENAVDLKEWANVVLCDKKFVDIQDELLMVYNRHDMLQIYSIAVLRVCVPGIKDYELKEAYDTSFLSEIYPGVALSKNTVCEFMNNLGKSRSRITAFMQNRAAAVNMEHWLKHSKKEGTYGLETLREKQRVFGAVVLVCDLDLAPETAYKAYDKRWEIEIAVRFYKSACEFDETRVHDDYSVIGSEFCDFLSTLLTFRLINAFDNVKLLEHMTYKRIMSSLKRAKKVKVPGNDWQLIKINPFIVDILQKLSILDTPAVPDSVPKKRGRPKKSTI
jgi:hypothetical protein